MKTNRFAVIAMTSLALAVSSAAFAAGGGGGGGGGGNGGAGAGGGHGGAAGAAMGAGGMSAGHMSAKGMSNTNGPISGDRDKGLARAEDRSDTQADRVGDADATSPTSKHHSMAVKTHHQHLTRKPTSTLN